MTMKLMKTLLSVLAIASVVFLSACGDDDPKPKTKTELLTGHAWKIIKLKVDGTEGEPADCEKDNVFNFETDFDYKMEENTKCDVDDPATLVGDWAFRDNETKIRISFDLGGGTSFSIDNEIVELTETTLKLKYTVLGSSVEETYGVK